MLQGLAEIVAKKAKHAVGASSLTILNARGKPIRFDYVLYRPHGENLLRIRDLVEKEAIKADVDRIFPLRELRQAHDYVEHVKPKGKVVIQVADS